VTRRKHLLGFGAFLSVLIAAAVALLVVIMVTVGAS